MGADGQEMNRNSGLPRGPSRDGTSMILSGNTSLPALRSHRDSTSSSLAVPGTPTSFEGLCAAPNMAMRRRRDSGSEEDRDEDDDDETDSNDNNVDDNDEDEDDGNEYCYEWNRQHHIRYHRTQPREHHFRAPAILECPMDFLQCRERFTMFQAKRWVAHSLEHFGNRVPPPKVGRCIFCQAVFDAPSGTASWNDKLRCAFDHHRDGLRIRDAARPDFALHQYMWEQGILDTATWKHLSELKAAFKRRGRPDASPSPPLSLLSYRRGQDTMVMTTNTARDRRREKEERERRRLEAEEARAAAAEAGT